MTASLPKILLTNLSLAIRALLQRFNVSGRYAKVQKGLG